MFYDFSLLSKDVAATVQFESFKESHHTHAMLSKKKKE